MTSIDETLDRALAEPDLEGKIAAAYEELEAALDRTMPSKADERLAAVMRHEAEFPASGAGRGLFLRYLRRMARNPRKIGEGTVRPVCCDDGWIAREGADERQTTVEPCKVHNPRTFTLWRNGHFRPGHPPCDECRPKRRPASPGGTIDEAPDPQAEKVEELF